MKYLLKFLLFLILTLPTFVILSAQSKRDVDGLYEDCQRCLDSTGYTEKCTNVLYGRLDSLLNVTYQNLQHKLPADTKNTLLQEQRAWLRKRAAYFAEVKEKANRDNPRNTEITNTFILDKETEFVRKRIMELIHK